MKTEPIFDSGYQNGSEIYMALYNLSVFVIEVREAFEKRFSKD